MILKLLTLAHGKSPVLRRLGATTRVRVEPSFHTFFIRGYPRYLNATSLVQVYHLPGRFVNHIVCPKRFPGIAAIVKLKKTGYLALLYGGPNQFQSRSHPNSWLPRMNCLYFHRPTFRSMYLMLHESKFVFRLLLILRDRCLRHQDVYLLQAM